ncbi:MAG: hypothetical protein CVU87_05895 [Firmicutes bacterium HGW-Firmicutes-12]|nr:MAG: hypothetical protein CVU87_05895 [Firmicutes bacterium HGW-Firmicutes-12]
MLDYTPLIPKIFFNSCYLKQMIDILDDMIFNTLEIAKTQAAFDQCLITEKTKLGQMVILFGFVNISVYSAAPYLLKFSNPTDNILHNPHS